jgi:hypothetical protein
MQIDTGMICIHMYTCVCDVHARTHTHTHEFSCLLQGERENYERSQKRPKHMLAATKHGSVRAAMPMMQVP